MSTTQIFVLESVVLIRIFELKSHALSIASVSRVFGISKQSLFCGFDLLFEDFSLLHGELKSAQELTSVHVLVQKLLVVSMVLVGLALLSGHLAVTEELLSDRCVVLNLLSLDI